MGFRAGFLVHRRAMKLSLSFSGHVAHRGRAAFDAVAAIVLHSAAVVSKRETLLSCWSVLINLMSVRSGSPDQHVASARGPPMPDDFWMVSFRKACRRRGRVCPSTSAFR